MKPLFVMFVSPLFTCYKQIKVYIYNTEKKRWELKENGKEDIFKGQRVLIRNWVKDIDGRWERLRKNSGRYRKIRQESRNSRSSPGQRQVLTEAPVVTGGGDIRIFRKYQHLGAVGVRLWWESSLVLHSEILSQAKSKWRCLGGRKRRDRQWEEERGQWTAICAAFDRIFTVVTSFMPMLSFVW